MPAVWRPSPPDQPARAIQPTRRCSHILSKDTQDLIDRSIEIGFVDYEGESGDGLLFNGNLFKRDTVAKSQKVLSSLSSEEQSKVAEFDEILKRSGCILASKADSVLGRTLVEKLKAAGAPRQNRAQREDALAGGSDGFERAMTD